MSPTDLDSELGRRVRDLVRKDFTPRFGDRQGPWTSHPLWSRLRQLGTELWIDTGDIDAAAKIWTREFSALTTNNTLLNKEIQKGTYDGLMVEAAKLLKDYPRLTERDRRLELAFILNARHGLRLVEQFDAYVSVEEHTDLASNVDQAVAYARRYYAVCPERFIVKIPFTAAGLLATRKLSAEGIPVNHTLGFSARQNYVITLIGRPRYVNVFLGRLNSFVADNKLGDGQYVGEKATLASQAAVRELRQAKGTPTRQIAASFRQGRQVGDLAGVDVMTIPPNVAAEFRDAAPNPEQVQDCTGRSYVPKFTPQAAAAGLNTLWDVEDKLIAAAEALQQEDLEHFTPEKLIQFFARRGCGDFLVDWTAPQRATSAKEGKIPRLENWKDLLAGGRIGLDALINLGGLNSFTADQSEMDRRVLDVLKKTP
jgi:transaldolase